MSRIFGTDGIRGVANQYPITVETGVKLGKAVAACFMDQAKAPMIIIGRDSRISGEMFENALVAGICSMGAHVGLVGVLPTPGVAFVTSSIKEAVAGIVISASHNPHTDNGFKVFNAHGFKLTDEIEADIEKRMLQDISADSLAPGGSDSKKIAPPEPLFEPGQIVKMDQASDAYIDFLFHAARRVSLENIKLVIDCSNGATSDIAPRLFSRLGARVETLSAAPDGKNINDGCGSQNPESLRRAVLEKKADIGLAFDGDGDRVTAVDETGNVLTGDQSILICAKDSLANNELKNNVVTTTTMSNIGLIKALGELGIAHVQSDVGDRHVLCEMQKSGGVIGGEDSGHIIFLNHHTTGDGILAGLMLLKAMLNQSQPLSGLSRAMTVYPQSMINVAVAEKTPITDVPEIGAIIKKIEKKLGANGRVLARYSGTEPCMRIMTEGPSKEKTAQYCREIADVVQREIGK